MSPVVVTTFLLLVVLMSISDSEAGNPAEMCRTKYPATPCRNKNLGEGWFQMGNNRCVKAFITPHLGYQDAEVTCRKLPNGDLVSIHNEVELNQVICAMYKASPVKAQYRIGGFRKQIRGVHKWFWMDETNFTYSNWARGQPDFYRYREYCIEMNYSDWGLWNDLNCSDKKPYVCAVKV
ncbi:galactose-specific lectin nattectin-like isoform X21 [Etheostoma cragini]|uniref:galactose-specific lectin nattectin-like isoform X21 n=1 Tax=Etheostoma cragini TaxID=417921 RepID=UPI00155E60BC|nr:galactose-specific lectin nattectin-like isoform X21 [Etheostoma cragini]